MGHLLAKIVQSQNTLATIRALHNKLQKIDCQVWIWLLHSVMGSVVV